MIQHVRRAAGRVIPSLSAQKRDPIGDFARYGLFDLAYYRAQVIDDEPPRTLAEARRHYTDHGRAEGLAIHPLIEPEWWDPHAGTVDEDALGRERWLIHGGQSGSSTSFLVADPTHPIGCTRDYLIGVLDGTRPVRVPGGLTIDESTRLLTGRLADAIASAPNDGAASNVDWAAVRAAQPDRIPGRTSVLTPTFQDWRMTVQAVRAALDGAVGEDIEVVVVDNGSRPAVLRSLLAVFLAEPRVHVVRCSVNTNFAGGMNRAIAESTGEFVVLLNNDAEVGDGWLAPLLAPLRADAAVRGTQPLLMYPSTNRIQAAGTMFLGEGVLPWHFLAGHPREDAERVTDVSFHAVTAAVMALRADDLIGAEGFDEEFENGYEDLDLCLRLLDGPRDRFELVRDSVAVHPEGSSPGRSSRDSENRARFFQRWAGRMPAPEAHRYEELGLRLESMRPLWFSPEVPILITDPHLIRPAVTTSAAGPTTPSLRWLLLAARVDESMLEPLRRELTRCGQEWVTVRGGVHSSDGLAEVVVAFDRSEPTFPRAGAFNILISDEAPGGPWQAVLSPRDPAVAELIADIARWKEDVYPHRGR